MTQRDQHLSKFSVRTTQVRYILCKLVKWINYFTLQMLQKYNETSQCVVFILCWQIMILIIIMFIITLCFLHFTSCVDCVILMCSFLLIAHIYFRIYRSHIPPTQMSVCLALLTPVIQHTCWGYPYCSTDYCMCCIEFYWNSISLWYCVSVL